MGVVCVPGTKLEPMHVVRIGVVDTKPCCKIKR